MLEDIVVVLENKNLFIKVEIVSFLVRCFVKSFMSTLLKKLFKLFCISLIKVNFYLLIWLFIWIYVMKEV